MYLNRERRLVYLAHPRTASVATAALLLDLGFEKSSDHHLQLGYPVTQQNRHEWSIATTVRNHWDAAVSWVFRKYSTRGGEPRDWDFAAFNLALGESNRWVRDARLWWLHEDIDVVLRYETLDRDLSSWLGLKVEVPYKNESNNRRHRDYHQFYTDSMRDFIGIYFMKEIDNLGYSYD